jgi:predicted Co/Zn/Cd cation transporter (cation efflux family)
VGREVFLEVNFLINNQSLSVNQMDEIRNKIKDAMEGEVWLNVNFTTEEIWL